MFESEKGVNKMFALYITYTTPKRNWLYTEEKAGEVYTCNAIIMFSSKEVAQQFKDDFEWLAGVECVTLCEEYI